MIAVITTTKKMRDSLAMVCLRRGFAPKMRGPTDFEIAGPTNHITAMLTELRDMKGYTSGVGMPSPPRWIVTCHHDAGSPASKVKCFDEYGPELLAWAGKYWEQSDLQFDPKRDPPFWVDPKSGYFERVHIERDGRKRIVEVTHADGEGPTIRIMKES